MSDPAGETGVVGVMGVIGPSGGRLEAAVVILRLAGILRRRFDKDETRLLVTIMLPLPVLT